MDLFGRISKLMGEDIHSEVFADFINDLKEAPLNARALYFFPESGFSLITKGKVFIRAFLNVCTPQDPGHINPFKGELTGGVLPKDSRDVVRQKLRGKLTHSDATEDQFDCSPLTFFVKFNDEATEICSLSLGYREDSLPDGIDEEADFEPIVSSFTMSQRPVRRRVGPRHKPKA